jgi:hypothetical protein
LVVSLCCVDLIPPVYTSAAAAAAAAGVGNKLMVQSPDICATRDVWPMLFKNLDGVGVYLAERDNLMLCAPDLTGGQSKTAYTTKEV